LARATPAVASTHRIIPPLLDADILHSTVEQQLNQNLQKVGKQLEVLQEVLLPALDQLENYRGHLREEHRTWILCGVSLLTPKTIGQPKITVENGELTLVREGQEKTEGDKIKKECRKLLRRRELAKHGNDVLMLMNLEIRQHREHVDEWVDWLDSAT
jgi:hypothetical protein